MSAPLSPGYATNSDSSANSSPLLPFGNKPLPSTNNNQQAEDDDGWGPPGAYDEGSPRYGSGSVDRQVQPGDMTGQNGRDHGRQEYDESVGQPEAGPSRKRPRLDIDSPGDHYQSYSGTPQPQGHAQSTSQQNHQPQHHAPHDNGEMQQEIPFPHQMPLPDNSKSLYLTGIQHPDIQRRKPYHPVPRIIMHSIFGYTPRNEISREIGDWLLVTCGRLPGNVEIEIKFGRITKRGSPERLRLPVKTEVLIDDGAIEIGFRSDMPDWAHKSMNEILNKEVEMTNNPSGHPEHPPHSYHQVVPSHTWTDDTFYPPLILPGQDPIPDPNFVRHFGRGRRRLSKNSKTNEVIECMQKVKIGNVHVYCPLEAFDFRVSVNCEFPCQAPSIDENYSGLRKKDRITYKHNMFQIDLTQVKTFEDNGSAGKLSHEVELEIHDPKKLLQYGYMSKQNRDVENRWEETMDSVMNTARLLNRNVVPPPPPAAASNQRAS